LWLEVYRSSFPQQQCNTSGAIFFSQFEAVPSLQQACDWHLISELSLNSSATSGNLFKFLLSLTVY
jgi:hypothetical protein